MIPPEFSRFAEQFLDHQTQNARRAIIELIGDEICNNPHLEPSNPSSKKRIFLALPAVFTKYVGDRWWIIYRLVKYPHERRSIIEIANIGDVSESQALTRAVG